MVRVVVVMASAVLLAACEPAGSPAGSSAAQQEAAEALESASGPIPLTPDTAQAGRIAAMQLSCGGESFRVAFEDARAVVINDDGGNTELALLPPAPDATNATFTDGRLTFTKEGGGDTPTTVRFARGRMAFQDCAIAVN